MVKKVIVCVFAVFFAALFLACSGKVSPEYKIVKPVHLNTKWTELPKGESFPWEDSDGFFPDKEHSYGFDRHTKPNNKEDSIVHASVVQKGSVLVSLKDKDIIQNKDGFVKLKINQNYGGDQLSVKYNYYICDPASSYPYDTIAVIDNSENEQTYRFTDYEEDVKRIAICRESESGIQLVQELHIHTYPWKEYDFLPVYYSNGGKPEEKNALIASYEFWESAREIYGQALVAPSIEKVLEIKKKDHLYTRVRGTYSTNYSSDDYCKPGGDIHNAIIGMHEEAIGNGLPKRLVFQLSLPTRRFWSLRANNLNNIVICGSPDEMPSKDSDYAIVPLSNDCPVPNKFIRWKSSDNRLYLVSYDSIHEELVPATAINLDFSCAGMAERRDYNREYYVGEMSVDLLAETTFGKYTSGISLTILPWSGNSTNLIASRELGKIMGLGYVHTDLPWIGDDNPNSEQNNIMFHRFQLGGHKLRQRVVPVSNYFYDTGIGYENQWDCLQRKTLDQSCSHQDWLFK
jgi:hypothetical protein